MTGPLDGVRILELTTDGRRTAAMVLADHGAEVIKVELPASDLMRRFFRAAGRYRAAET
jgi:crotonobetainyl-CoA:carnitine CoA-transferase CaiB-like acyl-CoA transferase